MNSTFREYVFGRSFTLQLSDRHVQALVGICRNEAVAVLGLSGAEGGLLRRGLIVMHHDNGHRAYRPTTAGLLVYQLLVEAGEQRALEEKIQAHWERAAELNRIEWEERFGNVEIKLKDALLRTPPALAGQEPG